MQYFFPIAEKAIINNNYQQFIGSVQPYSYFSQLNHVAQMLKNILGCDTAVHSTQPNSSFSLQWSLTSLI